MLLKLVFVLLFWFDLLWWWSGVGVLVVVLVVVREALEEANITPDRIDAVAYTKVIGSLADVRSESF